MSNEIPSNWWLPLVAGVGTIFGGLVIIWLCRIFNMVVLEKKNKIHASDLKPNAKISPAEIRLQKNQKLSLYKSIQKLAIRISSINDSFGMLLEVMNVTFSMVVFGLYIARTYDKRTTCMVAWNDSNFMFYIDFGCNVFLIIYFLLRFFAATDKVSFWITRNSLVDMLTIPAIIVEAIINRECKVVGLKFFRALILLNVPDVLCGLRICDTRKSTTFAKMIFHILGVWLTAAGAFHLIETNGDPWQIPSNKYNITYFESVWLHMVTMSTVGYGDFYPKTNLGRVFMIFFIVGGLALFGSYIPLIVDNVFSKSKFSGRYIRAGEKGHIIVCGCVTADNVKTFLRDFFHVDRNKSGLRVVFLCKNKPTDRMELILKKYYATTTYLQGTVLEPDDLDRAEIKEANACIVLCDKSCIDLEQQDAESIMRVIAIKNYVPRMRVIVQVINFQNTSSLQNISSWSPKQGDAVVCLTALKLGLLAQSCSSPGFSTLITNILTTRSLDKEASWQSGLWVNQYKCGCARELYSQTLSAAFVGLPFPAVAIICYHQLHLLLLAVEVKDPVTKEKKFCVNPPGDSVIIKEKMIGYFVTDSAADTRRVINYCGTCHWDVINPRKIVRCKCKKVGLFKGNRYIPDPHSIKPNASHLTIAAQRSNQNHILKKSTEILDKFATSSDSAIGFDSTGLFYWSKRREIHDIVLDRDLSYDDMHSHVVICAYGTIDSSPAGLSAIIAPLRVSSIPIDELKTVVLLGDIGYIEKDWDDICHFHNIFIMPGSPLHRGDIRSVNIHLCDMCVVLSIRGDFDAEEPFLEDRGSILASLNIKATDFTPVNTPNKDIVGGVYTRQGGVPTKGQQIPMIVDLVNGQNVEFVDDDDDDDPDLEFYLTQPFACGAAFAATVLDNLTSMVFYNRSCLEIVKTLLTGAVSTKLEHQFAEYGRLLPSDGQQSDQFMQLARDRCRICQLGLDESPLADFCVNHQGEITGCYFGDLFKYAMENYSIMCIGIYRLKEHDPRSPSRKRYVVTLPPSTFTVISTDKVFLLVPFHVRLPTYVRNQQPLNALKFDNKASINVTDHDTKSVGTQTDNLDLSSIPQELLAYLPTLISDAAKPDDKDYELSEKQSYLTHLLSRKDHKKKRSMKKSLRDGSSTQSLHYDNEHSKRTTFPQLFMNHSGSYEPTILDRRVLTVPYHKHSGERRRKGMNKGRNEEDYSEGPHLY